MATSGATRKAMWPCISFARASVVLVILLTLGYRFQLYWPYMFKFNLNLFNSKKITSFIGCQRKTLSVVTDTFFNVVSQNLLHTILLL